MAKRKPAKRPSITITLTKTQLQCVGLEAERLRKSSPVFLRELVIAHLRRIGLLDRLRGDESVG